MNIHITWLTYVRTGPQKKNRTRDCHVYGKCVFHICILPYLCVMQYFYIYSCMYVLLMESEERRERLRRRNQRDRDRRAAESAHQREARLARRRVRDRALSREYWSWKFWSAGPIFSLENMVRLCKNWSGLKDARFTSSFLNRTQHDSSSTKGNLGNSQRTLEKS